MRWILLVALMVLTAQPAMGCWSVFDHTLVLLDKLPESASTRDIVAKVRVLSYTEETNFRPTLWEGRTGAGKPVSGMRGRPGFLVDVEVLETMKGHTDGEQLAVFIPIHGCSEDTPPAIGKEFYISGTIKEGVFEGEWSRREEHPTSTITAPPTYEKSKRKAPKS